jgi:hypothetical protein
LCIGARASLSTLHGTGLASLSVDVATMLLLHIALTKASVCGKEINKQRN